MQLKMETNCQLDENGIYNLKKELKGNSVNYFDLCTKCSMYQSSVKEWMKHLVDRHPLPIEWMSDTANYLTGEKVLKPYTIVTESRKKRKKDITPRPLNSFMIFSRHLRRNVLLFFNDASNSEISKLLGKLWNNISGPIKSMYDNEAKKLASLHSKEFPEYKYQPKKKKKGYLTKRSMDNGTPLSNNSYESVPEKFSFSTSDVIKRTKNTQRETNSASVSSYGSFQESKSNSFINQNSKTTYFPKNEIHKPAKKTAKQPHKIVISNHIMDDSEGAESSPSSFKNTKRKDLISDCNPFISESHTSLSDFNFSSTLASLIKQNDFTTIYAPKLEDTISQPFKNEYKINLNNYRQMSQKSVNSTVNLMTPLTIVTDKIDNSIGFQSSKINMRFVKVVSKPQEKCEDLPIDNSEMRNSQINICFNANIPFKASPHSFIENPSSCMTGQIVSNGTGENNPDIHNKQSNLTNRKKPSLDPLIIEDMFETDAFDDTMSFDNLDNNNSSPWSFKSPNFKLSAGSSIVSDNLYKEHFGASPFHLSENENQSTSIHRLPAIGSWLRSNYSEFMI